MKRPMPVARNDFHLSCSFEAIGVIVQLIKKFSLAVTCLSGAAVLAIGQASASSVVIEQVLNKSAMQEQWTGKGVKVGVLDGVLDRQHPAFSGLKINDLYVEGNQYDDQHGNFVTGVIIGAKKDGPNEGAYDAEYWLAGLENNNIGEEDIGDYFDRQGIINTAKQIELMKWLSSYTGDEFDMEEEIIPLELLPYLENIGKPHSEYRAGRLNGLLDKQVFVVNNSWSDSGFDREAMNRDLYTDTVDWTSFSKSRDKEIAAFKRLAQEDRLAVFATGNEFKDQPGINSGLPKYLPELQSNWLAVTAVDDQGKLDGTQALDVNGKQIFDKGYANGCGDAKGWCVAAPGTLVGVTGWRDYIDDDDEFVTLGYRKADPEWGLIPEANRRKLDDGTRQFKVDYERGSGTSFAAPAVTRTVAKVKEKFGYMGGGQVQNVILTTATQQGAERINDQTGWGLLDEARALQGPAMLRAGKSERDAFYAIDGSSAWTNDISGKGDLIKTGQGSLRLTGNNSYEGVTFVQQGVLAVDGKLQNSQLLVGDKAALQGVGHIGRVSLVRGMLQPGNAGVGRLSFEQGLVLDASSRIEVTMDGTKAVSGVDVKGSPFILGGELAVSGSGGAKQGEKMAVLSSQQGFQGGFSRLTLKEKLAGDQHVDLRIGRERVEVQVNAKTLPGASGLQGNQKQGAPALNALRGTALALRAGAYNDWLQDALDGKAALNALSASVTGQVHADAAQAGLSQPNVLGSLLSDRLSASARIEQSSGLWLSQLSARQQESGSAGIDNSNRRLNGSVFGFDFGLSESLRLGAALSEWSSQVSVPKQASSAEIKGRQIALYGRYGLGESLDKGFYLGGNLSYADLEFSSKRSLGQYRGKNDGKLLSAEMNIGWQGEHSGMQINPQLTLRHSELKRDALHETGAGGFALHVESDLQKQDILAASIRAGQTFDFDGWNVTPSLSLGYEYRLSDVAQSKTNLQGFAMSPAATGSKRGSFNAGAGVEIGRGDWTLGLNVSGYEQGGHAGALSLSVAW